MATIEKNEEHVTEALSRLLEQFKHRPNIEAVISALVSQIQDLENAAFDLYTKRWIDSAEGVHLDNLGKIVGQPRAGMTDPDFRLWIKARIISNRTRGRYDDLLAIADLVLDTTENFYLYERDTATLVAALYSSSDLSVGRFFDILFSAKAAGVRLILEHSSSPFAALFRFAPSSAVVDDSGYGFGVGALAGAMD
jgi:hypothetical protein